MHNSPCENFMTQAIIVNFNTKQEVFTSGGLVGFAGFGRGGRGIEGGGGCKESIEVRFN